MPKGMAGFPDADPGMEGPLYLLLCLLLCDSIPLLHEANELFSPAIDQFKVAVGKFGSSNLYRALELFPFAFNLVPVYWFSPELGAAGRVPLAWQWDACLMPGLCPSRVKRRNLAHRPGIEG